MNSSTWLLLRLIKWRIMAGMVAAFSIFFFLAMADESLKPLFITLFTLCAGANFTLLMRLHTFLSGTVFPVTNKQLAWIPMAVVAVVTVAGLFGVLSGQLMGYVKSPSPEEIRGFWLASLRFIPIGIFLYLILWRFVRMNFGWLFFLVLLPQFTTIMVENETTLFAGWVSILVACWPIWLAGIVLLTLEAPALAANVRRLEQQKSNSAVEIVQPVWNAPIRSSWLTGTVDVITILTGLLFAALYIFSRLIDDTEAASWRALWLQHQDSLKNFVVPLTVFIILCGAYALWHQNRASGMSRIRASMVLLLEFTIIGYAFRHSLGVKRGTAITCERCNKKRMIWYADCPHCGVVEMMPAKKLKKKWSFEWNTTWRCDYSAFLFRRMIPAYILGAIIVKFWLSRT